MIYCRYIGHKNCCTHFHVDACATASWNILLTGGKKWIIVSKKDTTELQRITNTRITRPDSSINIALLTKHNIPFNTITQTPGTLIFVPPSAGHSVINMVWQTYVLYYSLI